MSEKLENVCNRSKRDRRRKMGAFSTFLAGSVLSLLGSVAGSLRRDVS